MGQRLIILIWAIASYFLAYFESAETTPLFKALTTSGTDISQLDPKHVENMNSETTQNRSFDITSSIGDQYMDIKENERDIGNLSLVTTSSSQKDLYDSHTQTTDFLINSKTSDDISFSTEHSVTEFQSVDKTLSWRNHYSSKDSFTSTEYIAASESSTTNSSQNDAEKVVGDTSTSSADVTVKTSEENFRTSITQSIGHMGSEETNLYPSSSEVHFDLSSSDVNFDRSSESSSETVAEDTSSYLTDSTNITTFTVISTNSFSTSGYYDPINASPSTQESSKDNNVFPTVPSNLDDSSTMENLVTLNNTDAIDSSPSTMSIPSNTITTILTESSEKPESLTSTTNLLPTTYSEQQGSFDEANISTTSYLEDNSITTNKSLDMDDIASTEISAFEESTLIEVNDSGSESSSSDPNSLDNISSSTVSMNDLHSTVFDRFMSSESPEETPVTLHEDDLSSLSTLGAVTESQSTAEQNTYSTSIETEDFSNTVISTTLSNIEIITELSSVFNSTSGEHNGNSVCAVCKTCTNDYIDRVISDVTSNLPSYLELPNRQGRFQLYHGKLFGLETLRRSDAADVSCTSDDDYTVMVPLQLKNAKAFYKWQVEMPLRTFYGDVNVTTRNAESLVFYSHSKNISIVETLKITALDNVQTEFSGLGPLNGIFAGITRIIINVFRRSFARILEDTLVEAINKELQDGQKYEEYYAINQQ